MAQAATAISTDSATQFSRRPREPRRDDPKPTDAPTLVIAGDGADPGGTTPEDALAQATETIKQKDEENARLRTEAQRAAREAEEARVAAARAGADRISDRETAIGSAIDAATGRKSAAMQKLRSAKEAGNLDAELEAQEELTDAQADLKIANGQKAAFEDAKARAGAGHGAQGGGQAGGGRAAGPTPEAQRWIQDHPRFNSDVRYRADAIAAHTMAIEQGNVEGSPAYIGFINDQLDRIYGADHGRDGARAQGDRTQGDRTMDTDTRRASSTAAPSARDDYGSSRAGGDRVRTLLGEVRVLQRNSAGEPVKVDMDAGVKAKMIEGARSCNMDLGAYVLDQLAITAERAGGGDAGLVADDRVYS